MECQIWGFLELLFDSILKKKMHEVTCEEHSSCHPVRVRSDAWGEGNIPLLSFTLLSPSIVPSILPHSTWMIGDSVAAAATSDDGFIAVIICKAAEYRTSDDDQD